jgi:ABC-type branched-subunit amino acid transport system substrate-binding protein
MLKRFNPSAIDSDAAGPLTRRRLLVNAVAFAAASAGASRALAMTDDVIRLGQSVALTGPLADIGKAMHTGARVCFDSINARGGINGRRIELVVRDDAYDVKRSQDNLRDFLKDPEMFGLFGVMGTPMVEAMLPMIRNTDVPCFAPLTGASSARPADMRNVLNVRASYPEEADRLVEHLATIGLRRIAVVYQNNSFGKEVLQAAETAMRRYSLKAVATATVQNDASDAPVAAQAVAAANPEAVLIGLAGKPTIVFVKSIRAARKGLPLYALSVAAPTLAALGEDSIGIAVSQVVPLPTNSVMPVVRDFTHAWRAANVGFEASHLALEGYINARVFSEALRRSGKTINRKSFIDTAWSIKRYDLGGYELNFEQPGRNASRFVELTMIGRSGRFIR